jgi:hypothetical protein
MVNKRAQITIFIIIVILLVFGIGIIFVVKNSLKTVTETLPVGTDNVGDFVTNCLKITSENGLILIGRQGGYYTVPSPSIFYSGNDSGPEKYFTELGSITVPYYLYSNSMDNMPTIQTIESQLSFYVEENLDDCLNNLSVFKQKGFEVQAGEIKSETNILDEKVRVSLNYPVTIKKADFKQQKTVYNVDVPIRLGLIYNLTKNMVLNHTTCPPVNNPPNLNQNCFNVVRSNNLNIAFIRLDNTALLIFTDNEYKLNNIYNDWIFAYQYT